MNLLVSIIIPTYNRADLISETLDCVLDQSYQNWECIIVDDFSSDSTLTILEKYSKKDQRFVFYTKSLTDNKGAGASRNIGLQKAKGEFIQFLDSDDLIAKNKIETQIKALCNENGKAIATCKWGYFSNNVSDGEVYQTNLYYKNFAPPLEYLNLVGQYGGFFPLHCFFIPKTIIDKAGHWNEELSLNDDGEFMFRVFIHSTKIIFSPETNVLYRKNDKESLSTKNTIAKVESLISSWKIIENNYLNTFGKTQTSYLDNRKKEVYKSIKHTYPKLIKEHKEFFKKQIKLDDDKYNIKLNFRKVRIKLSGLFNKYLKL